MLAAEVPYVLLVAPDEVLGVSTELSLGPFVVGMVRHEERTVPLLGALALALGCETQASGGTG